MAKRKTKKPQPEDAAVLLDAPVVVKTKKKSNFNVSPLVLLAAVVLAVGASIMGWFYVAQQQSIDELTETFTSMQQRVSNFQKVMDIPDAQNDGDRSVEERISALEESQKQAQEKATVTLSISEEVKNSELFPELLSLRTEMNARWEEMKQAALSVTSLQDMFKNQSGELALLKESVAAGLSSSTALSDTVDRLTAACSRVVEQVASVDALNAQFKGQASDLHKLRDLLVIHSLALHAHNQEMAAIKEAVKAKQVMRAKALEEMLSSVRMSLNEQFSTSQNLHSSVLAQLLTFQTQLETGPSWPIKHKSEEEDVLSEETVSTTIQSATEQQEKTEDARELVEEAEDEAEEEDTDEEAEEEDTDEEAEEEIMQEEEQLEQDVDTDVTEEEEMTPEEDVEEEMTPEENTEDEITSEENTEDEITSEENTEDEITSEENTEEDVTEEDEETETTEEVEEEQEDADETAEEELAEETIADHILDEGEEEASEEEVEESDPDEEESPDLTTEPSEDTEDDFDDEDEAEFL